MKSKKSLKIEEVYDLVPYYVTDDAGFPRNFDQLELPHRVFLEDFFHYAAENLCDCATLNGFLEDLHSIKNDLEGVLSDYEDNN